MDYRFADAALLQDALTHRSVGPKNYERLEFLGDSILSLVVSQRLYERYPDVDEGGLSRMRARIVRGKTLAEVAARLDLGKQIRLGQGEMKSGGFRRSSILADALEALLGAILLDGGYPACQLVIGSLFYPLIDALPPADSLKDAKTLLQEWLQARGKGLPEYRLVKEQGADHSKSFHVECHLGDGLPSMTAVASSRRKAEQMAAALCLEALQKPGTSASRSADKKAGKISGKVQ
ncbi:MAG TPA: ribonuclease III [Xanthomonadales bacterium]|nr:ribonuclease III [Xanthomonadales bacterium]